jgi:hypothetical protein
MTQSGRPVGQASRTGNTKGRKKSNRNMILIRYFLICLIGFLIVRSFVKFGGQGKFSDDKRERVRKDNDTAKKVSKEIGEYVDYEEIKK